MHGDLEKLSLHECRLSLKTPCKLRDVDKASISRDNNAASITQTHSGSRTCDLSEVLRANDGNSFTCQCLPSAYSRNIEEYISHHARYKMCAQRSRTFVCAKSNAERRSICAACTDCKLTRSERTVHCHEQASPQNYPNIGSCELCSSSFSHIGHTEYINGAANWIPPSSRHANFGSNEFSSASTNSEMLVRSNICKGYRLFLHVCLVALLVLLYVRSDSLRSSQNRCVVRYRHCCSNLWLPHWWCATHYGMYPDPFRLP